MDHSKAPPTRLDRLLADINREYGYPAVVAAVASSTAILAAGATGVRRAGGDEPATVEDAFHIGSIGKPLAATLFAALVEEGRLSWDTRPGAILARSAGAVHPLLVDIRLRDLLAHQAGIMPLSADEEVEQLPSFIPALSGDGRAQRRALALWLLGREPAQPPRTGHLYSNASYVIAGALAEEVMDRPWEDLMRERLFDRLGLASAGFDWPAVRDPQQPWGHRWNGERFIAHRPDDSYHVGPLLTPAGDIHMNMFDLVRFGQLHLWGLAGEDTLVSAAAVRTMHTPHDASPDYGLGWVIDDTGHQHTGSGGTFFAFLLLRPEADRVYAFATNGRDARSDEVGSHVRLASEVLHELVQRCEEGKDITSRA
jgi:CubicO group peptidase (beta-lactamase class C family)